jgi:hypothetical protein
VDAFEALVQRGLIPADRARELRAIGEEVIRARHEPGSLFAQGWEHWTPPPAWTCPRLPVGWDVVP